MKDVHIFLKNCRFPIDKLYKIVPNYIELLVNKEQVAGGLFRYNGHYGGRHCL